MRIGECCICHTEIKFGEPKILVTIIEKKDGKILKFCSNIDCLLKWAEKKSETFINNQNIVNTTNQVK